MIWRAAYAAALLLVLAACSSAPGSTAQSTATPARHQALLTSKKCADLIVLGARGSTQSADKNKGVGLEVLVSIKAMAARLHQRKEATVRVEAVRYDASGGAAYQAQVGAGAELIQRLLASAARQCPHSRFGLVGFSEGAQVVHAAALDVPQAVASRVSLIAMIADPRRNPSDAITHWSYGESAPRPGRLGAGTPIHSDVRKAAISLCAAGDEICNGRGSPGAAPSSTHRHFYEKSAHASQTGQQMDAILTRNGF